MSSEWISVVAILALLVACLVLIDRTRVIAVCDIERGRVRVVRGRLSARVLAELRDVAERSRLSGGRIVVRKEGGRPALRLRGIADAGAEQQFRNVIGRFKLAELR